MDTGEVTQLLRSWRSGSEDALSRLTPLVYEEMHRIARGYMHKERAGHTLQPTALINEAFLRLADQKQAEYHDRVHFIALASQAMKRVLVDHGRKQKADKRGGGAIHLDIDDLSAAVGVDGSNATDVALALDALGQEDETLARIVELRYFGGLTSEEIARVLDSSVPTITRRWALARAWLYRYLTSREAE